MAVVPLDLTTETAPEADPAAGPSPASGQTVRLPAPRRTLPRRPRAGRRLLSVVVAALLALPLIATAHHARPAPFGDHLTHPARVAADSGGGLLRLRTSGAAVEAYDTVTRWRHTRDGQRPFAVLGVRGEALALWSDGVVTDAERAHGGAVRWHRAIPDAAAWLRTPGARGGAGVLQPLDPAAAMLAVVTPRRIAAYRTADGDLRWVLPAREGCVFEPATHLRRDGALLIAQPCSDASAWSERIVAVDGLGRIVPRRTPLGNGTPGAGRSGGAANPLASHR